MHLRHFLDTQDFTKSELLEMIQLARLLKAADRDGCTPRLLPDISLAMIFEEPSTRTRVSFEVAMTDLGGHALYLKPGEIHLGQRESLGDTARVLARLCDIIVARTLKHSTLLELAQAATVPVINGLSDYNHPTQAVCDVMTMLEHLPPGKKLEDLQVVFIGDATNVLSSLMHLCTRLGMHFTQAAPEKYQASTAWRALAEQNCAESGGSLRFTDDPLEAARIADFLYTDLWWWVGQETEIPERSAAFMPRYQVNGALFAQAPEHCKFMHCLPASRGVEVTDEVLDSPRSLAFEQSENRLHTEKSLLLTFAHSQVKDPSESLRAFHRDRIQGLLERHKGLYG